MDREIRVLHVDDDPDFVDLAATFLERERDRLTVETATSASEGLDRLDATDFDCIVSDYDMPGRSGIEFLDAVREDHHDLPFILFTSKGSEEVASKAISAGVTGYLQKESGTDQYAILANRIESYVERARVQRERQRQLHAIETAQEGISILDEDGHFIYVNEAYADLYGYDPEEMVGEHWELIYRAEDVREISEEIIPTVEEQGKWHGRTIGLRADGSTFVEDHTLAMTDRGELICTARDVTDETALREKFELVARASTDAFWDWDPDTDEIIRSEPYLTQFGYERSDVGDDFDWWRERIHPDDRERVLTALKRAVDEPETTYDETYRFRKNDGTYGYVRSRGYVVYDETGEPERMIGAHVDITERKEREEELRTVARRFEAIFENPLTLIGLLRPDGTLVDANRTAMKLLDVSLDAVVGEPFWETPWWSHSETLQDSLEEWIDRAADGEYVRFEAENATSDGDTVTVDGLIHPVRDDEGTIRELLAIGRDITERKEYERELERQNEQLEEFASIVSHDLRNPLNVADGRLELAREECDSEHLDAVARAHERIQTLIDDLLTLARQRDAVIEVEPVALGATVEQCWRNVETADATLVTDTERTVRADRNQIQQLLENLIRNAVEHGGENVTVRIGDVDEAGFYVADDGPGIPEGNREQVFEAGQTTSETGTGFGLAIVDRVADAHDWEVSVTESEAGGARFEITDVEFEQ